MKLKVLFIICFVMSISAYGQGIAYQATVLNPNTELPGQNANLLIPLVSSSICMEFTIINDSNTIEYQETHQLITSELGRVDLVIGMGNPSFSQFQLINWDGGKKTLEVAIDYQATCSNFKSFSSSEFHYVPYAIYALEAANAIDVIPSIDQVLNAGNDANGNTITNLSNPVNNQDVATKAYVDSSDDVNDADFDATNELQDLDFDAAANTLKLTNNGTATTIDLSKYLDNTDSQVIVSTDANNLLSSGTDSGALLTSVDDNDSDATNELQDLDFDAAANTLKLTNNVTATTIDLSKYLDNTDSQSLEEILATNTSAGNYKISNLASPTLNTDAANKAYVDTRNTSLVDNGNGTYTFTNEDSQVTTIKTNLYNNEGVLNFDGTINDSSVQTIGLGSSYDFNLDSFTHIIVSNTGNPRIKLETINDSNYYYAMIRITVVGSKAVTIYRDGNDPDYINNTSIAPYTSELFMVIPGSWIKL